MSKNFDENMYIDNKGLWSEYDDFFDAPESSQEELDESFEAANADNIDDFFSYEEKMEDLFSNVGRKK